VRGVDVLMLYSRAQNGVNPMSPQLMERIILGKCGGQRPVYVERTIPGARFFASSLSMEQACPSVSTARTPKTHSEQLCTSPSVTGCARGVINWDPSRWCDHAG
jgi:hypothetical protein